MKTRLLPFWLRTMTVLTMLLVGLAFAGTAQAATCTVTSNLDDGTAGTLRVLLADTSCDTINFAGDTTIHLASQLTLTRNVTINGSGHSVVLNGDKNSSGKSDAGDVRVMYVSGGVTATIVHLQIEKGYAASWDGGGAIFNGGALTVTDSTFVGNRGHSPYNTDGGAIFSQGTLTVTGSTFIGNLATSGISLPTAGGAIYNYTGTTTVTNSTFVGNTATYGSAVANNSHMALTNDTFSGNVGNTVHADETADVTVTNSILFRGSRDANCVRYGSGVITGSNNLVDDGSCGSGFTNSSTILLGTLGDYGGSTQTLPLLLGSAAIDKGDDTYCPATDQRGVARVGACDIGAFESQGFTFSDLTGTPQGTGVGSAFATPLGLTVSANGLGEPVAGGRVTFTAPAEGASATVTGSPAAIGADGTVSVTAKANAVVGSYNVTASAAGASSVDFALMNMPTAITVLNANDSGPGSLRQALLDIAPDGTITFQGDTTIYLDSTLDINRSMTIDGGTNTVVLSGDTKNDDYSTWNVRVLAVRSGVAATLQNLAVTEGWAPNGGGIHSFQGTLTLTNVALSGNDATNYGGSILNSGGTVTLNNSSISDSSAAIAGGGIYSSLGSLTLNNSRISDSSAHSSGGGIYNNQTKLTVTSSTFSGNSGGYDGAGVYNYLGTVDVTDGAFSNNSAGNRGGAIFNAGGWPSGDAPGLLTVTNSTFSGNSATDGGAIYQAVNNTSGTLTGTVTSSTFSSNSATRGAGIEYLGVGMGLNVMNSTFSGNSAASGAGLYTDSGAVTVTNSTFSGQQGPALQNNVGRSYGVATTTSRNSLLVQGTGDNCTGTIGGSNNLADDGSCGSGFANSSTILLGTLGEYGGSTQTIPLLPGSAAINAAHAAYCPAADQRGLARVGTCDIGAFESQGFTLSDLTGTPQEATFSAAFATPLGLTVMANGSGEPVTGGQVSFTPPSSGASATIAGSPATIDGDGIVGVPATANAIVGPYTVTASSAGATSVDFSLNNLCTSSNITVQNANDSGDGSLRQAIEQVCTGGTISFASDTTVYLASTLTIGRNVTIDGRSNTVVLSGNANNDTNPWDDVQVFVVTPGVTAALQNLTVTNGRARCSIMGCAYVVYDGGGALYNDGGTVTLTNVTLSNNYASHGSGGAIYNHGGTVALTNSRISGGFSAGVGGAIYNSEGTVTLTNSHISGNFIHYYGGAIYNSLGTLNVTNSTFSANTADTEYGGVGGAIYNNRGAVTLTNSTFSGNTASSGSGVYNNSGTTTVTNSLLAQNSGSNCAGAITGSNNLADDASCGSGSTQSSAILLGPLGDYGGSTETFPLLPGSPAIDGASSDCPATDQRGVTRGTACDIGAFEAQFTLTKLGGDNQVTSPTAAFGAPLLVGVTAAGNAPLDGGTITFGAPSSGASAVLSAITATIAGGQASVNATANEYVGQYDVTAGIGNENNVAFHLANHGDTATTLTSSLNPSGYGDEVTFSAVVTINAPWTGTAAGTVTFYEQLGTNEGLALYEADFSSVDEVGQSYTFTTSSLSGGVHNIYAVYNGDAATSPSTSSMVEQTVNQPPTITEEPASQTVYDGQPASFSAAALGYPAPKVQWQVSTDGGATWTDIAGATASTYSFTASLAQNGSQYHAVFTNTVGRATSNAAALTVQPAGADLHVTMATNVQPSDAKITYSIVVTNFGPAAAQTVVLSDPLPAGTAFVSAKTSQGTCNAKNKVITCKTGPMDNGGSATITLVLKRTDSTIPIVNTATVRSATSDPDTANNSATVTVAKR